MWTSDEKLNINPPCWESAVFFLDTFTYLDSEFGIVDLVGTDMFDLTDPGTAEELDLPKAIRAIKQKTAIAKSIVKWIAENRDLLDDYPAELQQSVPVSAENVV
ncbi:MAG: hypothetical protein AAFO84_06895 [Cyanobacteria bacterium J06598_1]